MKLGQSNTLVLDEQTPIELSAVQVDDEEVISAPVYDGSDSSGGTDTDEDATGDPDADGGTSDGNPDPPK